MKSLAITSRSFSKNPILRREVLKLYPSAKFNDDGLKLCGGSLVNSPATAPDGTVRVAYCHDPEGNLLELVEEL